jgi:alpha-tubulin suppressor-like RCC1 family protein
MNDAMLVQRGGFVHHPLGCDSLLAVKIRISEYERTILMKFYKRGFFPALFCGAGIASSVAMAAQTLQFIPQSYSESSYVIDAEGMMLVWGRNQSGELGAGNLANATTPQRLPLPPGVTNWITAAGGTARTVAIDQSGRFFSCGGNAFQNLGVPGVVLSNLTLAPFPAGVSRWTEAAAGNNTLLLSDAGAAYVLGNSPPLSNYPQPYSGELVQVPLPTTAAHVIAGRTHYLVLGADGKIYLWGYNDAGQIGQGFTSGISVTNVATLPFPAGVTAWLRVAAGGFHCLAVGDDNNLYAWGANNYGQLGIGSNASTVSTPVQVPFPSGVTHWQQLSAGEYASFALGNNGRIYACGYNPSGILATGSTTNELQFKEVIRPAGVTNSIALGSGRYHGMAVGEDGVLYSWGAALYGGLGNGQAGIVLQSQVKPVLYRLNVFLTNATDIALAAEVPSGSNWVVEASGDLLNWTPASTNIAHQARLELTQPANAPGQFFRLSRAQ